MILSPDPDIYPSPTQKISHEPFPVFSCFSTKYTTLQFPFPVPCIQPCKDTLDHHIPFLSFSHKRLMPLLSSIFSHIQYQKDIMQKKTGTPIKEFRPYKA